MSVFTVDVSERVLALASIVLAFFSGRAARPAPRKHKKVKK